MKIEAYVTSIKNSPGSEAGIMIGSGCPKGARLMMRCFHSLDDAKCLHTAHITPQQLPHMASLRIPSTWEAGMYKIRIEVASSDGGQLHEAGKAEVPVAWEGIIVISGSEDVRTLCGAQALPASLRPLPVPQSVTLVRALHTSLEVAAQALDNPAVKRYRLLLARGCADAAKDENFRETAIFSSKDRLVHLQNGLEPGCVYCFKVIAEADNSTSGSMAADFKTLAMPPMRCMAPEIAIRAKNSLKLRWAVPDCRGAEITSYEAVMLGMPDTTVHDGQEASCHVKKLLPGTAYTFKVRATNSVGSGEWSPEAQLCTLAGPPEAPAQPVLGSNVDGKMRITWAPPALDNGEEVVGYTLEHDDGDGGGYITAHNGPGLECTVSVQPGTEHKFRVRALNSVGPSMQSPTLVAMAPLCPPLAPEAPIFGGKAKTNTVLVKWSAPEDSRGGAPVTGYKIFVSTEGAQGGADCEWVCASELPDPECDSHEVSGLLPGKRYLFCVSALSSAGESERSGTMRASTIPSIPSAPSPPMLGSATAHCLWLEWGGPEHDNGHEIRGYRLERQGSPAEGWILICEGESTTAQIDKLEEATGYAFRVSCQNVLGWGPPSETALFQTTSRAPQIPRSVSLRGARGAAHQRVRGGVGAGRGAGRKPPAEMGSYSELKCLAHKTDAPEDKRGEVDGTVANKGSVRKHVGTGGQQMSQGEQDSQGQLAYSVPPQHARRACRHLHSIEQSMREPVAHDKSRGRGARGYGVYPCVGAMGRGMPVGFDFAGGRAALDTNGIDGGLLADLHAPSDSRWGGGGYPLIEHGRGRGGECASRRGRGGGHRGSHAYAGGQLHSGGYGSGGYGSGGYGSGGVRGGLSNFVGPRGGHAPAFSQEQQINADVQAGHFDFGEGSMPNGLASAADVRETAIVQRGRGRGRGEFPAYGGWNAREVGRGRGRGEAPLHGGGGNGEGVRGRGRGSIALRGGRVAGDGEYGQGRGDAALRVVGDRGQVSHRSGRGKIMIMRGGGSAGVALEGELGKGGDRHAEGNAGMVRLKMMTVEEIEARIMHDPGPSF